MKKLLLVLGLVMGSMLASDALAYSVANNGTTIVNHVKPTKELKKKKNKKSCCKSKSAAASTSTTGCAKDHGSCCKKKTDATPSK